VDALGSLRQWTNAAGAGVGSASYAPFGGVLAQQGFTSPWGFAGEYHDPATGLQYLRARWYQPGVGRFTQVDPFPGVASLPLTQNPYVYGLNHPTRYTDPSGENPWLIAGGAVLGGIAGGVTYFATLNHSTQPFNGRDLGIAVGMGLVSGGFIAMGPMGSPIALASAIAGLTSAGVQVLTDKNNCFDWVKLANFYTNGAVSTALFMAVPGLGESLWWSPVVGGASSVIGDAMGRLVAYVLTGQVPEGTYDWKTYALDIGFGALFAYGGTFICRKLRGVIGARIIYKEIPLLLDLREEGEAISAYSRMAFEGGLPHSSKTATALLELLLLNQTKYEKAGLRYAGLLRAQTAIEPLMSVVSSIVNSNVGSALFSQWLSP